MYYWQIDDGRIWSSEQATFVDIIPEDAQITPLYDDGKPSGVAYLRKTILFYGLPLGDEIMTRLEKIQAIQAVYAPQLTSLQDAYASAQMLDNGEAEEIQQEYKQLLCEMQEKIQAVPND